MPLFVVTGSLGSGKTTSVISGATESTAGQEDPDVVSALCRP